MSKTFRVWQLAVVFCASASVAKSQDQLLPHLFPLHSVTVTDSLFMHAQNLNIDVLLSYDADRLLTPYERQSGNTAWEVAHPNFLNWGSGTFRLDGHVGGHYVSALALAYAASHDEVQRAQLKERLDYMVSHMAQCQARFSDNEVGLKGYIGGLPDNDVWTTMHSGDLQLYDKNRGNVPLYTMHKIFAGLRDAYVYAGNEQAKECFLRLCDWGVALIENLTDEQMQSVLDTEHGGINEMYADAYHLTGDKRYIDAAHRYTHRVMVEGIKYGDKTFLDGKHANTQVPKYLGFARTYQEDGKDADYILAARAFFNDVVNNRTTAIGGNSASEHFLSADKAERHITDPDGPESCNTNNMLKLAECLSAEPDARLADFYEYATLNHILSSQNPRTGGYVYFTSLRPLHFRTYSQPNQGMWCCVGTGMENHSKYGQFIYTRARNTLFINLFTASKLSDDDFAIEQTTRFPFEQSTTLTVRKAGKYSIAIRRPAWCKDFSLSVNGELQNVSAGDNGYVTLQRKWRDGDVVKVMLPMELSVVECPGFSQYIALRYGPTLLAAKTSTEDLEFQFGGEGRMDHAPSLGKRYSLISAPTFIASRDEVLKGVVPIDAEKLTFKISSTLLSDARFSELTLQPFFGIHESRYVIYWRSMSAEEWSALSAEIAARETEVEALQNRTLDQISTGEQQSDAGHMLRGEFEKGVFLGEHYIHALPGQAFTYRIERKGYAGDVKLLCRFCTFDAGRRFKIKSGDTLVADVELGTSKDEFYNREFDLPAEISVLEAIDITFEASENCNAGGLYELRLVTP